MKTLRMIGMALSAVLMCANLTSCGSDEENEPKEDGGIVVGGKKVTKLVATYDDGFENYTFSYDNKDRLIEAERSEEYGINKYTYQYQFIWGDGAIKVRRCESGSSSCSNYTLNLENGLVQTEDYGHRAATYTYNSSNRLVNFSDGNDWIISAIWDGDKLVSTSEPDDWEGCDAIITYEKSCKKGYFPLMATMMDISNCQILFIVHPELAGIRTSQLPAKITWDYKHFESETSTFSYEFDKDGYVTKIIEQNIDGTIHGTYTLSWE